MKIVITGGLGYIGTELCKLYSGEARFKNIVVIDKRFVSERVKQLRDWGIDYVNASIMDIDAMKLHLSDADVVIHLAGITDVAYTKTQSNVEQDSEIRETGINGTLNVLSAMNPQGRLIFPSTHVVYEGFKETKLDIDENEPVCPELTYATGKAESEHDIRSSGIDHVILRLASVYGYSSDTMRIGIMPNLFSKIASQNGTIKMFSGGVQMKSLVPLFDVARCMKFMAENTHINKETFHVSKERITVKEVAEMCKEINPKLTIIETQDEIPNLGYTISNKKLLTTGFEFRYDLKSCLKEMISNWSKKDINPALEYIDRGGKEFVDDRGRILNYELTEPINLIGWIESKWGTVRANHYHPIQEQKCLLVSGQYISVTKDLSVPNAPIETRVINRGDVAIIKPNVAHAMVFTEDSVFLNLVRGEREHENYGITHTIPYQLVDKNLRETLLKCRKATCRCCGNLNLDRVISFGESPLANNLKSSVDEESELYPLEMNWCSKCSNAQLSMVVPPKEMFDEYLYVSSTSPAFRKHFEDAATGYINRFGLNASSTVVDIGSNDGIALAPLKKRGINVLGVEPAKNIAKIANDAEIKTINAYFDDATKDEILSTCGKVDLVMASNVFAHADNLMEMARNVFSILKPDGTFIVEVQYLADTIKDLTFDNIYHEHVNYWLVGSLKRFFKLAGLFDVYRVEHISTHGGSIRVFVGRAGHCVVESSVKEFLDSENEWDLNKLETYQNFAKNVEGIKKMVRLNLNKLHKKYGDIAAYGSPAKATTALNYFADGETLPIAHIIEDNTLKVGKFIPGVNIPIRDKEFAIKDKPKIILVLAWNFFEVIKKSNQDMFPDCRFISIKDLENPDFMI